MDSNDISCRERSHLADVCVAEPCLWEKKVLPRMRCPLYPDLFLLWISTYSRDHALQPRAAGTCRRRFGSGLTSDSSGYIPCRQARVGVCAVYDRDCDSPGGRTCVG